MDVEGHAIVHTPDSVRDPAIACGVHESAGHHVCNLIYAGHTHVIVSSGAHHPHDECPMPILVLHIAILASIHKIGPIDVINDACEPRYTKLRAASDAVKSFFKAILLAEGQEEVKNLELCKAQKQGLLDPV